MQIGRRGFTTDEAAVARARNEFLQTECAVLPDFLAPDLAWQFTRELDSEFCSPSAYYVVENREFGQDLSFSLESGVLHALHLLLNNPLLFDAIRVITGCPPVGCFSGRGYRNLPVPEHHLDWHDDMHDARRLVGFSLNLSPESLHGGVFRLRRKRSHEILTEIAHSRPGAAHIFRIDPAIEHCVTPVESGVPRTAFAGWFLSSPDCRTMIQSFFRPRTTAIAEQSISI